MQATRGASLTAAGRSTIRWIVAIGVVGTLVDQLTKTIAIHRLGDGESVAVLGDFFQLTLVRNPGAAFSTGTSLTALISVFAWVALVVVLVIGRRVRERIWTIAFGLLLSGIVGNLLDRMFREPGPFRGHVIDFFHLAHWPVFNVADVCINVAAVLIVIQSVRAVPLGGAPAPQEEPTETEQ